MANKIKYRVDAEFKLIDNPAIRRIMELLGQKEMFAMFGCILTEPPNNDCPVNISWRNSPEFEDQEASNKFAEELVKKFVTFTEDIRLTFDLSFKAGDTFSTKLIFTHAMWENAVGEEFAADNFDAFVVEFYEACCREMGVDVPSKEEYNKVIEWFKNDFKLGAFYEKFSFSFYAADLEVCTVKIMMCKESV